jgi:hypothetical protein
MDIKCVFGLIRLISIQFVDGCWEITSSQYLEYLEYRTWIIQVNCSLIQSPNQACSS